MRVWLIIPLRLAVVRVVFDQRVCVRDRLFQLNDDKLADLTLINHTNTKHNSNQNDFYVVSRQVVRLVCYLLCSSVLQKLNDNN